MKLIDSIKQIWGSGKNVLFDTFLVNGCAPIERQKYGELFFSNIVELLTDLTPDVIWRDLSGKPDNGRFYGFVSFFNSNGEYVLNRLFYNGYCVIGYKGGFFWIMSEDEYKIKRKEARTVAVPRGSIGNDVSLYVLRTSSYMLHGLSDYQQCKPFIRYLDAVMNASAISTERLGSVVVASPASGANVPFTLLTKEQKTTLEQEVVKNYGALREQSNFMLLSRPMDMKQINMAAVDVRLVEKTRIAILAICDKIKVPANQVAIIDANNSRSLSNGGELHEGDIAKYRSFRRLLNSTFFQLAVDMGLRVDYRIENEPRLSDNNFGKNE